MSGYTQIELDDIQAKWELRFPPDLVAIYRERRRVIDDPRFGSFDWLKDDDARIRSALDWPLEGFLFDVGNGLWWPEWGDMPVDIPARAERLGEIFSKAPKLIPVCGHRYLPAEPDEAGNPVFSVWQMDVIHYGGNLADYVRRENASFPDNEPKAPFKSIPFWTRAVEFNVARFTKGGSFTFLNKNAALPEK